jgi:hypothetical protein
MSRNLQITFAAAMRATDVVMLLILRSYDMITERWQPAQARAHAHYA